MSEFTSDQLVLYKGSRIVQIMDNTCVEGHTKEGYQWVYFLNGISICVKIADLEALTNEQLQSLQKPPPTP